MGRPNLVNCDDKFRAIWASGTTIPEIALQYGVSQSCIRHIAERYSLPKRSPGRKPFAGGKVQVDQKFIDMWASDTRTVDMAAHYGVTVKTITNAGRRAGLCSRADARKKASQERRTEPQQVEVEEEVAEAAPQPRPAIPSHLFDHSRDCAIVKTHGKYAEIRDLAEAWQLPIARVQARWHLVRV